MGAKTEISWTGTWQGDTLVKGATFNPWIGCFKVSPGGKFCYAKTQDDHYKWGGEGKSVWGPAVYPPNHKQAGEVQTHRHRTNTSYWKQPHTWNKQAREMGVRKKVFCASLADVFEDHPEVTRWRQELWSIIEQTPYLDWLLLTKRPENIKEMYPRSWYWDAAPINVWLGTSVETQEYAQKRIPELIKVPARVHFLSCEPLLGPLQLEPWLPHIEWVITGGESGPKHRKMEVQWPLNIRDQCDRWAVPFFHKQNGGLTHASGGHLLDGEEEYHFPRLS